jgi:single-strand DNA-binding protein
MSKDLNKFMCIGRLGNDPEIRYMPNGNAVASINIAVGDDYKDKDGKKIEQTEWVRVSAFGKLAEVMGQYLKKGSKVYIEGKMKTRSYDKDGQKHYATEINASEMYMLDSKQDGSNQPAQHKPATQAPQQDSFDGDIPF